MGSRTNLYPTPIIKIKFDNVPLQRILRIIIRARANNTRRNGHVKAEIKGGAADNTPPDFFSSLPAAA